MCNGRDARSDSREVACSASTWFSGPTAAAASSSLARAMGSIFSGTQNVSIKTAPWPREFRAAGRFGRMEETEAPRPSIAQAQTAKDVDGRCARGYQLDPFVIGVAGASASGKSTVCEKIIQGFGENQRCAVIALDWFYHSLPPGKPARNYNFDHPAAFDFDALVETLKEMRSGRPVDVPQYDFKLHKRSGSIRIGAADVIIVEGIMVFYPPEMRKLLHMKIFVDEDADVCLCRRIKRDVSFRGREATTVIDQYQKFVKPAYEEFIFPTKRFADIIIPRGGENFVAIDLITQHISLKLKQDDLSKLHSNLLVMRDNVPMRSLHTIFRSADASREDFIFFVDRAIRLLVEEGMGLLPFTRRIVQTPTMQDYFGVELRSDIVGVSIIRGGEAMENPLRTICKEATIAKLLFEKHGDDFKVVYDSCPSDIASKHIFVMDPVIEKGTTMRRALTHLLALGVPQSRIIVLSLIGSPLAFSELCSTFLSSRFVTTAIDDGLNRDGLLVPGIGLFADRYFGTTN